MLTSKKEKELKAQIESLKTRATDYSDWEKDLGFLTLILTRKKNITKEFLINIYSKQKSDKDYVKDEEIEPIVEKIVSEVLSQIGENYKNFLIEKYFGSEDNLIKFISEDIYVDLISASIVKNIEKINKNVKKNMVETISKINIG